MILNNCQLGKVVTIIIYFSSSCLFTIDNPKVFNDEKLLNEKIRWQEESNKNGWQELYTRAERVKAEELQKTDRKQLALKWTKNSLIGVGIGCLIYLCFVMFNDLAKDLLKPKKIKPHKIKNKPPKKIHLAEKRAVKKNVAKQKAVLI